MGAIQAANNNLSFCVVGVGVQNTKHVTQCLLANYYREQFAQGEVVVADQINV